MKTPLEVNNILLKFLIKFLELAFNVGHWFWQHTCEKQLIAMLIAYCACLGVGCMFPSRPSLFKFVAPASRAKNREILKQNSDELRSRFALIESVVRNPPRVHLSSLPTSNSTHSSSRRKKASRGFQTFGLIKAIAFFCGSRSIL